MSLLHALVARGTTVLAETADGDTLLKPAAKITILSKIPPNNSKLTCTLVIVKRSPQTSGRTG